MNPSTTQRILFGLAAAALTLAGCGRHSKSGDVCLTLQAPLQGPAVATFDSGGLSAQELRDRMGGMPPGLRASFQNPAQRRNMLDKMVDTELLAREGAALGLGTDPDVVRAVKTALAQKTLQKQMAQRASPPSDADIEAYYNQHSAEFHRAEILHAFGIFMASEKDGKDAAKHKKAAEAVLKAVAALQPTDYPGFQALADKSNEDARTKPTRGDMGNKPADEYRTTYGAEVADALAKLKGQGELSPLVETPTGFYVLKLVMRTPEMNIQLKDAEAQIKSRLTYEHQQGQQLAYLKELHDKFHYTVNEAELGQVVPPAGGPPGPGMMGSGMMGPGMRPPPGMNPGMAPGMAPARFPAPPAPGQPPAPPQLALPAKAP
jgi:hypothetical protein